MEPITDRFLPAAAADLRAAVSAAHGNEVFLVGKVNEDLKVSAVRVVARGKVDAAPAILDAARPGEVVIHNHPSGVLTPSGADLAVASSLGNLGVGFLIVDNPVERVYVVVEPHRPRARTRVGEAAALDLDAGGPLEAALPGYEYRAAQVEMSRAVTRAFDDDGMALVEAGTGTGKSFAYLFPAARFARANDKKVVVSTNTINLQSQLIEKDVPQVSRALGEDVRAVLLKGRTNYICRRKLKEAMAEPDGFDFEGGAEQLEALAAAVAAGGEGSRQDLGFIPSSEVWERVQSESDTTLRVKCPHYNECFFYNSRRAAASADLVVVNHHLLLSDVEIRAELGFGVSALLPPYDRLVIDEAHHLEDAATQHMAARVSYRGLTRLTGRLLAAKSSRKRGPKGRIPTLVTRLAEQADKISHSELQRVVDPLNYHVAAEHRRLVGDLEVGFASMTEAFEHLVGGAPPLGREERRRVVPGLRRTRVWTEELVPRIRNMASQVTAYAELLQARLRALEGLDDEVLERIAGAILDVRSGARRLEERAAVLRDFLEEDDDHCRWIEYKRTRTGRILRLCVAPVEIGPRLKSLVFDRLATVVMTSATLRTGDDFSYATDRLGLSAADTRLETLALPSPFDFATQSFVGVPRDMPLPNDRSYAEALAAMVEEATTVTGGHAFVLFTSYRLLRDVFDRVAGRLRAYGMLPLRQGDEDRARLLERFRAGKGAVLFATSSFWEGVDVPGDALRLVILTKLPFAVPDEPILQARSERIEARGGDPFREYSVPQAVLRFRQGFGRLIRTKRDRGAVLVTDRRLIEKSYGATFRAGLPTEAVHYEESPQLLGKMKAFFAQPRGA